MNGPEQNTARPASVDDLKLLLRALNARGVDYLLIGGYALYALGYQRGTTDIDVVLRPTREQGERVKQALLLLPDKVSEELMEAAAVQLRLGVLLRAHHLDSNESLLPFDPGVVSWRDCVRITCDNGFLGPIVHAHSDASRNGVSNVGSLA
jgi:hypothetical protein